MTVLRVCPWRSNADLIVDVAKLGYIEGDVLDLTYGRGTFWARYKPPRLTACDLDPKKSPIGYSVDFTRTTFEDSSFDTVVLDPPYRLTGRPDKGEFEARYGLEQYVTWQDRYRLIQKGMSEAARLARKWVLLKCADQVCSGRIRWQTMDFTLYGQWLDLELWDRFDMVRPERRQPEGRRQLHARNNSSTLLVFRQLIADTPGYGSPSTGAGGGGAMGDPEPTADDGDPSPQVGVGGCAA